MIKTTLLTLVLISSFAHAKDDECREHDNLAMGHNTQDKVEAPFAKCSFVINPDGFIGRVIERHSDGKISYKRIVQGHADGYEFEVQNEIYVSDKLSPEVKGKGPLEKNTYAIDENDFVGKIKRVFNDGRIEFLREGARFSDIPQELSPEVKELHGISIGSKVVDEHGFTGLVNRIFKNGKIQYTRDTNGAKLVATKLTLLKDDNNVVEDGLKLIMNKKVTPSVREKCDQ